MPSSSATVLSIVGARPQFVKLGPVSRALRRRGLREVVIHTGQHYDLAMSEAFFAEFELPQPDVNLGIAAPGPVNQLGAMLPALADSIADIAPDLLIVFGDTTSTIAAAIAAGYAGVPVAHVEAGMRAFVPHMPEEIARTVTDRLSRLWFAPSDAAAANLRREGLGPVDLVGDTMFDVLRAVMPHLDDAVETLAAYGVSPGDFVLMTCHRAANTDDRQRLEGIMTAMASLPVPVVFPIHPRTRAAVAHHGLEHVLTAGNLRVVAPLKYLQVMQLARNARRVFTDSGGLQKEALYVGTPCSTLREETEWTETVDSGWNVLVGSVPEAIIGSFESTPPTATPPRLYGDGRAGELIAARVAIWLEQRTG